MTPRPVAQAAARHALVVCGAFTLLFCWLYARPLLEHSYLAESDLYEYFLPVFLSPATIWSSFEFGGVPAFADPLDMAFYPLRAAFAAIGSWTGLVLAAFVLAACFVYAYVYSLTKSRTAAAFAGVAFGLSEAMLERLAHLTTIHATAWLALILLSVDRLRGPHPLRWVAIGAFAVGNCILGGHPQIVVYGVYVCGLYAVIGGIVERAEWRYYVRLASMAAIGILLTAVKTIPVAETSELTARQSLNFDAFVSHANTPAQMLSILFPAIEHEGREAPTYVGIATLVFALTAAGQSLRNWRIAFWLLVAVFSLLLGAGDATPLAQLAYHLPLYDKFRVEARHLIFAALGLSVLAGLGVGALERGTATWRRAGAATGLILAAIAAAAAAMAIQPVVFALDTERGLPWELPIWNAAIWIQLAIALVTAVLCIVFAQRPRSRARGAALIVLLAADLVLALPYDIGVNGLDVTTIPASAIQPSTHAAALGAQLAPQHQRLLAPTGTQLDDVVPAAFARVWRIPIAGGYGPMLLARYADLAVMGTNGSIEPLVMADDNAALDLLAVRYVVAKEADLRPADQVERDGMTWSSRPLGLAVGRPECGQRYPRKVSYALPAGITVRAVAIVSTLRCSEDVPQGTEVAKVRLVGDDGEIAEHALLAGVDVAESGLSDPNLQRRARHKPGTVFEARDGVLSYLTKFELPQPLHTSRMEVEVTTAGWLEILKLSVIDGNGNVTPQEMPAVLFNPDRWHETGRFATSRVTDRSGDESTAPETKYVVFENRRALPRAWVAHEVVRLPDKDALTAIHYSRLPDGRPFDPRGMAIVDADGDLPARTYPSGQSTAVVRSIRDAAVTVDVDTPGGGFLVLSETFYRGWRARIGDRVVPVIRTDEALQGVDVPAGHHTVEFEMVSTTRRGGAAISILALVALALVAWRGFLAA